MIAFRINSQIVYLDQSYIKQKSLKEKYDSLLANIFNTFSYEKIDEICQKLKEKLQKVYKK